MRRPVVGSSVVEPDGEKGIKQSTEDPQKIIKLLKKKRAMRKVKQQPRCKLCKVWVHSSLPFNFFSAVKSTLCVDMDFLN